MRIALLSFAIALTACAQPVRVSEDLADSEFGILRGGIQVECYESLDDALVPLIRLLKAPPPAGERGASEFRVTQRDERVFVVDARVWEVGDDGRSFWHERHIFEQSMLRALSGAEPEFFTGR